MSFRPLVALALAATAVAAPAAGALTNCFGPSNMYVCVSTPDPYVYDHTECVYAGGTTCRDVTVPLVGLNGRVTWSCHGDIRCVEPA